MSEPDSYPQRNPHPYPVVVPAIPATVEPGETVTWPYPVAGLEPAAADDAPPAAQPAVKKKQPVAPATAEGVTGDAAQ